MKQNRCNYMHEEFPCKFYYLGVPHDDDAQENMSETMCKFYHGPPLDTAMGNMLIKHVTTAPESILGDFPRFSGDEATDRFNAQHLVLVQKYGNKKGRSSAGKPTPKITPPKRSRWSAPLNDVDVNLSELSGILSSERIAHLACFGIERLDQLFDKTLGQLTEYGLSVMEIYGIQAKVMETGGADVATNDESNGGGIVADVDMRMGYGTKRLEILIGGW